MTTKLNFTIASDVADRLRQEVAGRGRSAFVTMAIQERLDRLEKEQLSKTLIEGYTERRNEDTELNADWELPTLGGWS